MIAIDLSKQQELDSDQQEELDDNTILFFIIEEGKETILDFSKGTVKVS